MGDLVLSGGTSGTITVTPTAVAGSNTLTLPAATGTILTTASSGQIIPKAALPTGSVLQVVQGTTLTDTTITSTSYTDTTLTASITPTSSSSKILVIVTQQFTIYRESAATTNGGMQIVRGSTAIASHNITPGICAGLGTSPSAIFYRGTWAMTYLDSPATTSSTTYKTQAKVTTSANSQQIRLNQDGTEIGTITLMEIAA